LEIFCQTFLHFYCRHLLHQKETNSKTEKIQLLFKNRTYLQSMAHSIIKMKISFYMKIQNRIFWMLLYKCLCFLDLNVKREMDFNKVIYFHASFVKLLHSVVFISADIHPAEVGHIDHYHLVDSHHRHLLVDSHHHFHFHGSFLA